LCDLGLGRQEVVIWEIRAQEQQQIALVNGFVSSSVTKQSINSHVKRVVVSHIPFAPVCDTARSLDLFREGNHLIVSPGAPESTEQSHLAGGINHVRELRQFVVAGPHDWPVIEDRPGVVRSRLFHAGYIARQHNYAYPTVSDRTLHSDVQDAIYLFRA